MVGFKSWNYIARRSSSYLCSGKAYHNDPKFSDRLIWANSADPDQTAPRGAV